MHPAAATHNLKRKPMLLLGNTLLTLLPVHDTSVLSWLHCSLLPLTQQVGLLLAEYHHNTTCRSQQTNSWLVLPHWPARNQPGWHDGIMCSTTCRAACMLMYMRTPIAQVVVCMPWVRRPRRGSMMQFSTACYCHSPTRMPCSLRECGTPGCRISSLHSSTQQQAMNRDPDAVFLLPAALPLAFKLLVWGLAPHFTVKGCQLLLLLLPLLACQHSCCPS